MVASDRTYLSSIIGLLYVAASMHCLWRTIMISREATRGPPQARPDRGRIRRPRRRGRRHHGRGCRTTFRLVWSPRIRDLATKARLQGPSGSNRPCCCGLASRLRGSNQFGAFASDTLMKLGLLGTIIGFIMMLAPIAGLDTDDHDGGAILDDADERRHGGRHVHHPRRAVGLVPLKIQYSLLDGATAKLFAFAVSSDRGRMSSRRWRRQSGAAE